MSTTLYELSVRSYLQILPAALNILKKAQADFGDEKANELLGARITQDMLPLWFQIHSVRHHSIGAIEGIMRGEFGPPPKLDPMDFNAFIKYLNEAIQQLEALSEQEVNSFAGKPVHFVAGKMNLPFTSENFVLSFSLPNLNFHAATLYNLLRREGLALSKIDYLGSVRLNTAS